MKLGLAGVPESWDHIDAAAARSLRVMGFRGLSLFFPRPLETSPAALSSLGSVLADAGLACAQTNGAYEVLVHPDPSARARGIEGAGALCRLGRALDTGTVYVRPGSLNPAGPWYPHPANHTPAVFDRLADSLRQVARVAEGEGVHLAVEGHVLSPLDTPRRVRDLLDAVGSPALRFNMDPVNFVGTVRDAHDTSAIINDLCDLLGRDTAAIHLKDVRLADELVVHIEETPPGQGVLDQAHLLRRMHEHAPGVWALIEHLPLEKVPAARTAVLAAARAAGITLEG